MSSDGDACRKSRKRGSNSMDDVVMAVGCTRYEKGGRPTDVPAQSFNCQVCNQTFTKTAMCNLQVTHASGWKFRVGAGLGRFFFICLF